MGIGIALLALLGVGLVVSVFDDDDGGSDNPTEPEGIVREGDDEDNNFEGTVGTDLLIGGEGNDTLTGGGSADTLEGGPGEDLLEGNAGNDSILGQADDDIIVAGGGDDLVAAGKGDDFVQGRGGDDTLRGSLGADWIEGNDGDDSIGGGFDTDTLLGGAGADTLDGGGNNDLLIGGEVPGTPLSTENLEALRDGTETLASILNLTAESVIPLEDDNAADVLNGGDGNDDLVLGAGDVGTGGAGADVFFAMAEAAESESGPSTITDFNGTEDALLVLLTPEQVDGDPVSIDVTNEDGDAVISVNGQPISILVGAAGQIESGDIGTLNGL
ncbi:calcium-binding protein [Tateyamaria sp. ANG-S1]|uniref:calcium-binding protein n=1 Tax=Tateyamaria sp. ANG-S1 TaxID=1577905 RepID=UPI000580622F|nr:calcium-binding protein [Tateyamaria sp. ANG-S1]KIC48564.1 hypothetical protein RA29_12595 [Tateyamaria sp. ANG-S1]